MDGMILLTGAGGYIGSRLLRVLEEIGVRIRCLARHPERIAPGRATTEVMADSKMPLGSRRILATRSLTSSRCPPAA